MDTRNNVHLQTFRHRCFNVAMDFHPWIPIHPVFFLGNDQPASMLPWIFIHGYSSSSTPHNWCQEASMLPWIFIHGYCIMPVARLVIIWCFNVAMDFHPWILMTVMLNNPLFHRLQCCHGFSSMDTCPNNPLTISNIPLQCCHGFSSMDTGW